MTGGGEELKLGDFGLTMSMKQELAISPVGTVEYMAPEVRVAGETCAVPRTLYLFRNASKSSLRRADPPLKILLAGSAQGTRILVLQWHLAFSQTVFETWRSVTPAPVFGTDSELRRATLLYTAPPVPGRCPAAGGDGEQGPHRSARHRGVHGEGRHLGAGHHAVRAAHRCARRSRM